MPDPFPEPFVVQLLLILTAGLAASVVCRRFGVSSIVGYLAIGALLGKGALGLVGDDNHEVELLAEAGVFLLLFTVGLEFSLSELRSLAWRLPIGGAVQMGLVALPVMFFGRWLGLPWPGAVMLAMAVSFSSTVLVFKTLAELGQVATPHGRRAIGVLLFQDVALVPLLLAVPLLTADETQGPRELLVLALSSVAFVAAVILLRQILAKWLVPLLAGYRSPEMVVLLTIVVLGLSTLGAAAARLPPELGAFAAGLCFGGNRWSPQIDALLLPFRETFAAIFFVSLGLLVDMRLLIESPLTLLTLAVAMIAIKAVAAALAVRLTGLETRAALGVGLGLAHVGEFAFVLGSVARQAGLLPQNAYDQFAAVALLSLVVTPPLLKLGLRLITSDEQLADHPIAARDDQPLQLALVVGVGPVGKQVASYLETRGAEVVMIDRSPVNLYPFAQAGMHTVAGDAADPAVMREAHCADAQLVVVCVSSDDAAERIVRLARQLNSQSRVLVRCRFETNVRKFKALGASFVVSEEQQAYSKLIAELMES